MSFSKHNFLTLAPFTKRLGIAVFSKCELLYFAVKTFKPPRTNASVRAEISQNIGKLTRDFNPQLVIIKTLTSRQAKSKKLKFVIKRIKREAESHNLTVKESSLEQVKQELCSGRKATKTILFKTLSDIYPEIKRFTKFQNLSQAEYYNSVLSAIAIGFYFQSKPDKSKR